MAQVWFIQTKSGEKGPFTGSQIKKLANSGQVTPKTRIRRGSASRIYRASQVSGLFAKESETTQPTPGQSADDNLSNNNTIRPGLRKHSNDPPDLPTSKPFELEANWIDESLTSPNPEQSTRKRSSRSIVFGAATAIVVVSGLVAWVLFGRTANETNSVVNDSTPPPTNEQTVTVSQLDSQRSDETSSSEKLPNNSSNNAVGDRTAAGSGQTSVVPTDSDFDSENAIAGDEAFDGEDADRFDDERYVKPFTPDPSLSPREQVRQRRAHQKKERAEYYRRRSAELAMEDEERDRAAEAANEKRLAEYKANRKTEEQAYLEIREKAESGDRGAQNQMGMMYLMGEGLQYDWEEAYKWYTLAATENDSRAGKILDTMNRGEQPMKGRRPARSGLDRTPPHRYLKSIEMARKTWLIDHNLALAAQGDVLAWYRLARHYERAGQYDAALEWYQKVLETGRKDALHAIGYMYLKRGIHERSPAMHRQAIAWFTKAAEAGETSAMFNLGLMYERGFGGPKDLETAYRWLHKAADAGDTTAMAKIAAMSHHGQGTAKDPKVARIWLQNSAEGGSVKADRQLQAQMMGLSFLASMMFQGGFGMDDGFYGSDTYDADQQQQNDAAMVRRIERNGTGR